MEKFTQHEGIVAPLNRSNIDTDAIIPKQFLKSIHRTGFGQHLFDEWRYLDVGYPGQDCTNRPLNPDFILNKTQYKNSSILLARENFGCGSSREHAPWALVQFGFKVIIANSFADIFFNNCYKNSLLPIILNNSQIDELFNLCEIENNKQQALVLKINLAEQTISINSNGNNIKFNFEITIFRKYCLINGLDEIGLALLQETNIKNFESNYYKSYPWLKKGISNVK